MDIQVLMQSLPPERVVRKSLTRGEAVLSAYGHHQTIPVVLSGNIKVSRAADDGREVLVYYLSEGDCCVGTYLNTLIGKRGCLTATAETDAELLLIPTDYFQERMRSDFRWMEYVHREIARRFNGLMDAFDAAAFQSLEQRLWDILQKKAALRGERIIPVTHAELALELATARNVVSRLLKQFEGKGMLRLGRSAIELL